MENADKIKKVVISKCNLTCTCIHEQKIVHIISSQHHTTFFSKILLFSSAIQPVVYTRTGYRERRGVGDSLSCKRKAWN